MLPLPALFLYLYIKSIPVYLGFAFHVLFWALATIRLWTNRRQHDLPLLLVVSYAIFCLLLTIPVVFWHVIFPKGLDFNLEKILNNYEISRFSESYFVFYILEAILSFGILFLVFSRDILKREAHSVISWILGESYIERKII
jgi:hypothetical protein